MNTIFIEKTIGVGGDEDTFAQALNGLVSAIDNTFEQLVLRQVGAITGEQGIFLNMYQYINNIHVLGNGDTVQMVDVQDFLVNTSTQFTVDNNWLIEGFILNDGLMGGLMKGAAVTHAAGSTVTFMRCFDDNLGSVLNDATLIIDGQFCDLLTFSNCHVRTDTFDTSIVLISGTGNNQPILFEDFMGLSNSSDIALQNTSGGTLENITFRRSYFAVTHTQIDDFDLNFSTATNWSTEVYAGYTGTGSISLDAAHQVAWNTTNFLDTNHLSVLYAIPSDESVLTTEASQDTEVLYSSIDYKGISDVGIKTVGFVNRGIYYAPVNMTYAYEETGIRVNWENSVFKNNNWAVAYVAETSLKLGLLASAINYPVLTGVTQTLLIPYADINTNFKWNFLLNYE